MLLKCTPEGWRGKQKKGEEGRRLAYAALKREHF